MEKESSPHLEKLELRKEIDRIDEELMQLLSQRLQIAERLGEIKKQEGVDVYDPKREAEVLAHWQQRCHELGIPPEQIQPIVKAVILLSRNRQEK